MLWRRNGKKIGEREKRKLKELRMNGRTKESANLLPVRSWYQYISRYVATLTISKKRLKSVSNLGLRTSYTADISEAARPSPGPPCFATAPFTYPTLTAFPTPWRYWLHVICRTLHQPTLTCNHSNISCLLKWDQQLTARPAGNYFPLQTARCWLLLTAWPEPVINTTFAWFQWRQPASDEGAVLFEVRPYQQPRRHCAYPNTDARGYRPTAHLHSIRPSVRPFWKWSLYNHLIYL